MKHTTRNVLAAASIGILLAGCFLPTEDGSDPFGDRATPTESAPNAPQSSRPTRTAEAGTSLEGRFSFQTMGEYVDAVVPMITECTEATWRNMPLPDTVYYVPRGTEGPSNCLDASGRRAFYSSESYEYCPSDATIYVGQDMLWEFYSRTGDAGPAVGLAHEFGHHIQEQVGVPSPQTATESIRHENQADCIAGAWTKYTDERGWLEYPDDLEDIDALFPLIGAAEQADRDHGTARERLDAFSDGFEGGLTACNAFYPAAPLIAG